MRVTCIIPGEGGCVAYCVLKHSILPSLTLCGNEFINGDQQAFQFVTASCRADVVESAAASTGKSKRM